MNDTLLQNMQQKCRACLVIIDSTLTSEGIEHPRAVKNSLLSPDLCRLFLSFTTLDVRYELEEFPKQLCQLCADQLNEYEEFREKALASTRELYLSLKKSAISGNQDRIQRIKQEQSYNDCPFGPNEMCAVIMDATGCNDVDENVPSAENNDENHNSEGNSENDGNNNPVNIQSMSPVFDRCSESRGVQDGVPEESTNSDASKAKNPKFICFICPRQFRVELYFKAHMRKVHEGVDKPFSCEKCSKSFKTSGQLTTHMNVNCGKPDSILKDNIQYKLIKPRGNRKKVSKKRKEFVCKLCERQLSNKGSLRLHMLRHQPSAKHQCTECDVAKNTAYELGLHMRVHNKKYKCPECDVEEITPYHLRLHMRIHNKNLEKSKCPLCPQLFPHKNLINRHIRVVHEETYVCSHCPKRFGSHTAQLLHEKNTHAKGHYFCKECCRSFPVEKSYKIHLKKHNMIQCNLCPKRFMNIKTLAEHQKVHLGDYPNVCSVCSHGFYNVLDLKLHVEQKHAAVNNCRGNGGENQNVLSDEESTEDPYEGKASQDYLPKSEKKSRKRKTMDEVAATEDNDSVDKRTTQSTVKSGKNSTSKTLSPTNRVYKKGKRSSARISNSKK